MGPQLSQDKRAALYIRVSTPDQAQEGYSLDAQERILRTYCDQKGFVIAGLYADKGLSAKDVKNRPALQRLLADVGRGDVDIVLIWRLSRITRNLLDLCSLCNKLDEKGVTLISYSEAFDGSTPTGRMVRNLLGVIAQYEREIISENVRAAMIERAAQGARTCSYVLGYNIAADGDFKINWHEAKIILYIFTQYLEVKNMSLIAASCETLGYRGKMGGRLAPESIRKILSCPIYCGYNRFGGELYQGRHRPIISVDMYNEVQALIAQVAARTGRKRKNPLLFIPKSA